MASRFFYAHHTRKVTIKLALASATAIPVAEPCTLGCPKGYYSEQYGLKNTIVAN